MSKKQRRLNSKKRRLARRTPGLSTAQSTAPVVLSAAALPSVRSTAAPPVAPATAELPVPLPAAPDTSAASTPVLFSTAATNVAKVSAPEVSLPERPFDREESITRDDSSIPPVGDFDSAFFDVCPDPFDSWADSGPAVRPFSPAAISRRARLAKYVQGAVALSSALCVVALAKAALVRAGGDGDPRRHDSWIAPTVPTAPSPPLGAVEAAPGADVAPRFAAATARGTASSADLVEPKALGAEAARQREIARVALERGKVAEAIVAGQSATALDPGNGEAWLILGAAYQQGGDLRQARISYQDCLVKGKRGPRGECAAMLR